MELSQNQVRQIINHALTTDAAGVRQLLSLEGVETAKMSQPQLTMAVLKAIKDSGSFRANFAAYIKRRADNAKTFIAQPSYRNIVPVDTYDDTMWTADDIEPVSGGSTTSTTTTDNKNTSFFASLGSSLKNNLDKILGTGLDALSTKLKADANKSSEQAALELERLRLAQIQAQNAAPKKMPTWAIVALIVALSGAGLIVVGTIIYLTTKKK